jgi:hypothetical protein
MEPLSRRPPLKFTFPKDTLSLELILKMIKYAAGRVLHRLGPGCAFGVKEGMAASVKKRGYPIRGAGEAANATQSGPRMVKIRTTRKLWLIALALLVGAQLALAQAPLLADPLPSWNEGAAK